jgi:hypothetical protein
MVKLAVLEAELAKLKSRVEGSDAPKPWWVEIAGTFQDDPRKFEPNCRFDDAKSSFAQKTIPLPKIRLPPMPVLSGFCCLLW